MEKKLKSKNQLKMEKFMRKTNHSIKNVQDIYPHMNNLMWVTKCKLKIYKIHLILEKIQWKIFADTLIFFAVYGMSQGIILPLSGYVAQFIGLKNAIIVGCIIFQIATYLTYFSLQHSLVTVSITYGFLSSLGANIALIPPMTIGKFS